MAFMADQNMINISSSFFELVTHSRVTTWRAYVHVVDPPPFLMAATFVYEIDS